MTDPSSKLAHLHLQTLTSASPSGHTSALSGPETKFWVQVSQEIGRCMKEPDRSKHQLHIRPGSSDPDSFQSIIEAFEPAERALWEWVGEGDSGYWCRRVP